MPRNGANAGCLVDRGANAAGELAGRQSAGPQLICRRGLQTGVADRTQTVLGQGEE